MNMMDIRDLPCFGWILRIKQTKTQTNFTASRLVQNGFTTSLFEANSHKLARGLERQSDDIVLPL
jgi:hypothetical protein